MHPQVDGHQQDVVGEQVHLLGPAAHGRETGAAQLGEEERVEGVGRGQVRPLAALHQQVHVEVNHLQGKSKQGHLKMTFVTFYTLKKNIYI